MYIYLYIFIFIFIFIYGITRIAFDSIYIYIEIKH